MLGADSRNPYDRRYTVRHQWVTLLPPHRVGITRFAQEQLGEISYLELPEPGEHLAADESFGVIESRKAVSDMFMPVAGSVIEVNDDALGDHSLIDLDPYIAGWLLTIEPDDPADIAHLLDAPEYEARTD